MMFKKIYCSRMKCLFLALNLVLLAFFVQNADAQIYDASPANWLFPEGNSNATRYVSKKSNSQVLDSIKIKWSTNELYGDIQPLVGNIINNPKLFSSFDYAPNEIVGVMGNDLVIIDGSGKIYKRPSMVEPNYIKAASMLIDTTATVVNSQTTRPVVIGLETTEHSAPDSMAYAYIAGFDDATNNSKIIKRLALNMRRYAADSNLYAGIKPVYAKLDGTNMQIYATVNILKPNADDIDYNEANVPFFRGMTQFNSSTLLASYPLPDVKDEVANRIYTGPEVSFAQPTIAQVDGLSSIILPSYGTPNMTASVRNFVNSTNMMMDIPYALSYNLSFPNVMEMDFPLPLSDRFPGNRPLMRAYYIDLNISNLPTKTYVLMTEEYKGIDGSTGTSRLHLYNAPTDAQFLEALTLVSDPLNPPYSGEVNHQWSVSVGNIDGKSTNNFLPFYPNNVGNEIIVSQSTKDFAYPNNKIMILRYSDDVIEKPTAAGDILFPFDTLCTIRMNGWVAAVNDLDNATDEKDEIIVVDGSKLLIMRMRDYSSVELQLGYPFDTVYVQEFKFETISGVAIADIEGDGMNDIIVSTYKGTYILGTPLKNVIDVVSPIMQAIPPKEYCISDTVEIMWRTVVKEQDFVNIRFQEIGFDPNNVPFPIGDLIPIADSVLNVTDTVTYNYKVDTLLQGKTGIFIVKSIIAEDVFDFTSILNIKPLVVNLTNYPQNLIRRVGDTISIWGETACFDSLAIEWSVDSTNWEMLIMADYNSSMVAPVNGLPESKSYYFQLGSTIPCVNVFNCLGADSTNQILLRVKTHQGDYIDYSNLVSVGLLPATFPAEIDTTLLACPHKMITWDINDLAFACDSLSVLYSVNGGLSYTYIETIAAANQKYELKLPLTMPDTALIRICCESSCIRLDTLIGGLATRYVDIIAPNPYSPNESELDIIYKVPEDTHVSIKIFDQNNNLVVNLVQNQFRAAGMAHCDKWNGELADGSFLANGLYYIVWEIESGVKQMYPLFIRR